MRIGKPKPPGVAGVTPVRKPGDPLPPGYFGTGQPTKYRPEYCKALIDFFDRTPWEVQYDAKGTPKVVPVDKVPTIGRWCRHMGISQRTVGLWMSKHPEFAEAHATAMELQKSFYIETGTALGVGSFVMFALKCHHGMSEPKQESPVQDLAQQLGNLIEKLPS
jgi:hypothetical protein